MSKNERSIRGVDSDLLRIFVAVAEQGSVTRAGRYLGRTQSAVSVQIRKLEQALSAGLFERRARGVVLSDAGRLLLPAARRVLGEIDRIGDLFSTPLAGRVSIGIPDDYGSDVLERILAAFAARHAGVEVSMRCGISAAFPDAVEAGDLDLAVFAAEAPDRSDNTLFTERTVWVARQDWRSPAPDAVPLALFDRSCWWRDAAIEALSRAGLRYRVAVSSESVSGVKAAVRSGLAIAMLAETALDPGMCVLDVRDGFPPLPDSALVLKKAPNAANEPAREMERAIRDGFLGLRQ